MARLIDADALVSVVERARKKAKTLTGMDFVMVTKSQPTVPAIPVEWLEKQASEQGPYSVYCQAALEILLSDWREKQEAQDGKAD